MRGNVNAASRMDVRAATELVTPAKGPDDEVVAEAYEQLKAWKARLWILSFHEKHVHLKNILRAIVTRRPYLFTVTWPDNKHMSSFDVSLAPNQSEQSQPL